MIIIFVEFIDQLIDYPINRASLIDYNVFKMFRIFAGANKFLSDMSGGPIDFA